MDAKFFAFWSRCFQAAAEGQKRMDTVSTWVRQGFDGIEEMNEMMRSLYLGDSTATDDRVEATQSFRKSFGELARAWGWVTLEEHQQTLDSLRRLERKTAEQQATIERQCRLLDDTGVTQEDLLQRFQDLMVEQGDQFRRLMEGFGQAMGRETDGQRP
jgi:hypothetical protein